MEKYRLVTRSDFDGLVCAVLLKELDLIDDILFVHPKDMQDGKVKIGERDITTNLPYVDGVYLAFDHHISESIRLGGKRDNHIIDSLAPSASRVVYRYFGAEERFPDISKEMIKAVDKADSADFTKDEILNPKGWVLLSFIMDARTGLGRFHQFRISNYELMLNLIDYCKNHTIDEILDLPDIKERVDLYMEHQPLFIDQLKRCSKLRNAIVVLDIRKEPVYIQW
jgi:nanoRNase/pAp phosphatase (c-di-AMP/oligoRNAs hydrolase)